MEGPIRQAEAVPVPLARRRRGALVAVIVATALAAFGATASRAARVVAPDAWSASALAAVRMPPTVTRAAVSSDHETDDDDDAAGGPPVRIPAGLLLKLRAARAADDLGMFEDVAHEIALLLVR